MQQSQIFIYRAANSIFSKIGRTASEEVILQIISSKCMPVVAFVTDLPHFALNDPSYSPYDVTYDVIGNPH